MPHNSPETKAEPPLRTLRRRDSSGLRVRMRSIHDIDARFLQAWHELEQASCSRNPFASAAFTLAAARNLPDLSSLMIFTVEQQGELLALTLLENCAGSRRMPLRHLRAWQTPHTYFDAPLLHADMAERSMEEFWKYFLQGRHDWHAIEFPRFPVQDPLTKVLDGSSQAFGIPCLKGSCWERAALNFGPACETEVLQHLSLKRSRSLRRGGRELEKLGQVHFEIQQNPEQIDICAQELLELEAMGWKSETGTALASHASHQQFFHEMISAFNAEQKVFFTRIQVNGQTIASVANLIGGDIAYAFKLGWNPEYERGCPGFQLKLQTAIHASEELPGLSMIDSCSAPGSFIEHVWPNRRSFCNRLYITSPVGQLAASMVNGLRWVRNNALAVSRQIFPTDPLAGQS